MSESTHDVIIIGSGIAGLTATKQLLQSQPGLSVANIEAELFGGLVINIQELDGKIQGSGVEFASSLMIEATELGAAAISERVTALAEDGGGWKVTTAEGIHRAQAVIVASGAVLKKLSIPGEDEFEHKGVSRCADCDGPIFSGQDVVVAGGGDSALQEAHILARFCKQVHVVNRTAEFSAQPHLIAALSACGNILVRHLTEVEAILGKDKVEKVQIRNLTDKSVTEIACSGFFGFIGLNPALDFMPTSIPRDASGFLITDDSLKAGNGLFVAGAARSGHGGMLEHAIADGIIAAKGVLKGFR